jgi:hypothetical protein
MKIILLSLATLGGQFAIPVSDRVPHLNVETTCRAITADDKASGLALPQTYEECMRDENTALQQLNTIWLTNSDVVVRDQCEGEATAGGNDSYVDLLTCIEMAGWVKSKPPTPKLPTTPKLRGASKNRNKL